MLAPYLEARDARVSPALTVYTIPVVGGIKSLVPGLTVLPVMPLDHKILLDVILNFAAMEAIVSPETTT